MAIGSKIKFQSNGGEHGNGQKSSLPMCVDIAIGGLHEVLVVPMTG